MSSKKSSISGERRRYRRTTLTQKEILVTLVQVGARSIHEAAHVAGVNESTARNIISAYRKEGAIVQRSCGGNRRSKLTAEVLQRIEEIVEQHPEDNTLRKIQERLKEVNIELAVSSIFNALRKLKIKLKKCHYELDRVNMMNMKAAAAGQPFSN